MDTAITGFVAGLNLLGIPVMIVYAFAGGTLFFPRTFSSPQRGFRWALAVWPETRFFGVYFCTPAAVIAIIVAFATDGFFSRAVDPLLIMLNLYYAWCWYRYNPNDRWKKLRKKLAEKITIKQGRLVVVPHN